MNSRRTAALITMLVFFDTAMVVSQPVRGEMTYIDRTFRAITRLQLRGPDANESFDSCLRVLRRWRGKRMSDRRHVVFPLRGKDCASIPSGGRGYMGASAYSFFDGNRHRGHPALDVFILDRNMDAKDDRTGRWVDVVSVADGLVLSTTREWTPDSVDADGNTLRGGICVWVYDPREHALWYYAHLSAVEVRPGDIVQAGVALGRLGRTGKNAALRRSSTHLHLMFLSLHGAAPSPRNVYDTLCSGGAR